MSEATVQNYLYWVECESSEPDWEEHVVCASSEGEVQGMFDYDVEITLIGTAESDVDKGVMISSQASE